MTKYINNKVLLLAFYQEKAPGVRYLANYLNKNGFETSICFIKSSPSNPSAITEIEINLLKDLISKNNFLFIGFSILSSYTLSEVYKVNEMIKNNFDIPIVWGGVYPSLAPRECAKKCDILIRGEGEIPIVKLAQALMEGNDWKEIKNLCYYDKNYNYVENELEPLIEDLDEIDCPIIGGKNMYLIECNRIINEDPQLHSDFPQEWDSYDLSTTRGCPFACSYCSSSKIRDLYKGKGKYIRYRSVDGIIKELKEAISKNPKIKEIRFWDEVFTKNKKWTFEFAEKYKKEIGLRFVIWGHPLLIDYETIKILVDAGLRRIIVGFQSGSPNIRNNIFKRPETNEQIIESSKILSKFPLLEVYYDLIICHILESIPELKETFDLCLKLEAPFGLQIHGLSFLPKTDLIQTLIDKELYTEDELEEIFNAPFEENYKQWNGPSYNYYADNQKKEVWADLIYLTQFMAIRSKVIKLSKNPEKNKKKIKKIKTKIEKLSYEKQEKLKRKNNYSEKVNSLIIKLIDKIKKNNVITRWREHAKKSN